ncbi:MAG TPA: aspartyl/asparaginyl beta-hydroxylase domain-containing protein [Rhizomicrobium sp.]|nr:aspartyl/asparaginyl beta-hydroxylase domain-containing protein [Rhizomicrobium sp.]
MMTREGSERRIACDWDRIPDRVRLPISFDPELLARDLAEISGENWIDHFLTDRYSGNWDVIPLRGPAGVKHPILMIVTTSAMTEFENAPALAHCPYLDKVIRSFDAEVRGARLLRLSPGSTLKEHTDHEDTAKDGILRIHIPVVTNPDVVFLLNGTRIPMEAGSAWYLRLREPHSVTNAGSTDRVHLLVDLVMNDGLAAMLSRAAEAAVP